MYCSKEAKSWRPPSISAPTPESHEAYALLDHPRQFAVGDDRGGRLEPVGEGVHPADVGVEEVLRVETVAAQLGVEVEPARGEAAVAETRRA